MFTCSRLQNDQSGEGYVDVAIIILIVFVMMASLLAVFPILSAQQSLNNTVRQIVRTVEITGNAGSEVDVLLNQITSAKPDNLTWQTTWKDATNKTIQLKTPFTVTATKKAQLVVLRPSFGDPLVIEVEISATASGISEVYFK
jgi:Flp pilus assembly protein TadG